MQEYNNIQKMIERVWLDPLHKELLAKKIDVSLYESLNKKIPDSYLNIEEVFQENIIKDIWDNFKPYLQEPQIFPFMEVFSGGVICIGYSEKNMGEIFYFDFDFGHFLLNKSLNGFLNDLIDQ